MGKEPLHVTARFFDEILTPDADPEMLRDRLRVQEWLKLQDLPSELYTEGLKTTIGRTVLELGARGRMQGPAIFAGLAIANAIDAAAAKFTREYVERNGSIYPA